MRQHLLDRLEEIRTPAFVVDQVQLDTNVDTALAAIRNGDGDTLLLFAMKSFTVSVGLARISASVDGFHASSLFEAKLARQVLGPRGIIHITTPGLRDDEFEQINELCDYVSFNSISQWLHYRGRTRAGVACGLRINPQLSLVPDCRYDPCRQHSKLGAPLDQVVRLLHEDPAVFRGLSGLLIHTNCDAEDFRPLLATVQHLESTLAPLLRDCAWINLGGGYLFDEIEKLDPLEESIERLRSHNLEIMFEPGSAISRSAGYLVARVIDLFDSGGRQIAVLDTSVNHLPEVFEYQYSPDVHDARPDGKCRYVLAGSTCLAGDLFGEYTFIRPLHIGDPVVFENAGSYSLVKANMFNGVNLPSIYAMQDGGNLDLIKTFNFADFLSLCGESS